MEQMSRNLTAFDPSCHMACYPVVYKAPKSRCALTIACDRRVIPARKRDS